MKRSRPNPINRERRKKLYEECFGEYSKVIRAMTCLVCPATPCDPHHALARGAGGKKRHLVPLCNPHHGECHMGQKTFEKKYNKVLLEEAGKLWLKYGEGED